MSATFSSGTRFNLLPTNAFSREVSRFLDDLVGEGSCNSSAPVSIWEDDTHYHFDFDLPGTRVEDIDLEVVENVLHISAKRELKSDVKFLRQERSFGEIKRKFNLPTRIDESGIAAEMNAGVLNVSVPKAPEAQVKKIDIKEN